MTETHRSTDLVAGQFPVANTRALRHKSKRCCVVSECCATICMRDRRTSEACTGRFTCSGEACHVCRLRPLVTQSLRTSFSATTSVVSRRLTFSTDRSTRKRLTGHVCNQWLCVARPQVQTVAKLRTPTTLYKTDHYIGPLISGNARELTFLPVLYTFTTRECGAVMRSVACLCVCLSVLMLKLKLMKAFTQKVHF